MEKQKKKRGDRCDAYLVADHDPMHVFMPYLLPNRADNEAVMTETVDMTEVMKYVEKKNTENPEFKYTMFHVLCAAIAKTIALRPKMNYFYSGHRLYERKEISLAFIVKRQLTDSSDEVLAIVKIDRQSDVSPIEQIHSQLQKIVYGVRKRNETDGGTDTMAFLSKLPRSVLRLFKHMLDFLEYHGHLPKSFLKIDPYHCSVFLSNLGSIKLSAQYHHLTNWGTNSFFVIIGEKHKHAFFHDDGTYEMKDALQLGLTIDERIADGVYFSNSVKIVRKLLADPSLLDLPVNTSVNIEK